MTYTLLLVNGHFSEVTAEMVRLEGLEQEEMLQTMMLALSKGPKCEVIVWKEDGKDE